MSGPLQADHDDDDGSVDGDSAYRARIWGGRRIPAASWAGRRWRSSFLTACDALHHTGLLHVSGIAGGFLPKARRAPPSPGSRGRGRGRRSFVRAPPPLILNHGEHRENQLSFSVFSVSPW